MPKYVNKKILKKDIKDIQSKLLNLYLNKGYVLARVYIDVKSINENRILKFVILEGKVNMIYFDNQKYNTEGNKIEIINPFNLHDLEPQIKRLDEIFLVNIRPSNVEGEADIEITDRKFGQSLGSKQ